MEERVPDAAVMAHRREVGGARGLFVSSSAPKTFRGRIAIMEVHMEECML